MTELTTHLEEYLRLRRALGFELEYPGQSLPKFIDFIEAAGSETLTAELAIAWASQPQGVQPLHWAHRLSAVRGFARYLQTIDPATEVPARDVFGARQQRQAPYLWSDVDIRRLVEAAHLIQPELAAASCEALFGLLAASGMRISEALDLEFSDVNLADGVVHIRDGKFCRARLVPIRREHGCRLGDLCETPRGTVSDTEAECLLRLECRKGASRRQRAERVQSDHLRTGTAHRGGAASHPRLEALGGRRDYVPCRVFRLVGAVPALVLST